ncbi:CG13163 [Drosophila busckii]|uniref:CG13163 n=1 Tax=Drosophila busckii TaxID=30019 RepID=A0A0M4EA15_DROBS|nr:uncharacterized protein LOC108595591 [Drosophila busckii]ALC41846.1 CG13163 [Drosophila busckii]
MQRRLFNIRNLLSLRAWTLQLPSQSTVAAAQLQQQAKSALAFTRTVSYAIPTKKDDKSNRQQQKITLIAQNEAMSVTTMEEAQKLAKRNNLHIMRLNTDAKTGRTIFKLVTAAEMLADDHQHTDTPKSSAEKAQKRTEKSLTIGARMTDHDLASRLKNITKWLNKRHEVRILIQGNLSGADESNAERIVKAIEQTIKEPQVIGKIVQKRHKNSFIKFSILPTTPMTTEQTNQATPNPGQS